MLNPQDVISLLRQDVVPALGCTEPVCVALCAANAAALTAGEVRSVTVCVNAGIYKNGMSAGIPHADAVGLPYASALGALLRDPAKKLELLADVDASLLERAKRLVQDGAVSVRMDPEAKGLYVRAEVDAETGTGICEIRGSHTNVTLLEKDSVTLVSAGSGEAAGGEDALAGDLAAMRLSEIRALVDSLSEEELAFMEEGVEMNERLAGYSETQLVGVGIADALRRESADALLGSGLMARIITKTASAAESRLDGCPLPTMSSSGAGTKGIVVILPVNETADAVGASREKRFRALALSHLINRYINAHIGKLSPMCSCVAASSTAAAAGITYLLGGSDEQIGHAVRNMAGTVTGMICDGGKVGCALKVAAGSSAALLAAVTAVHGASLRTTDGICAETPEACIRNMARIGKEGMAETNRTILAVMCEKNK